MSAMIKRGRLIAPTERISLGTDVPLLFQARSRLYLNSPGWSGNEQGE